MILLGAYAGLRVSEIAAVRGQDVDMIANSIAVVGKGGKRRDISLHPVLVDLARSMPPRTWWFPSSTGNHRYRAGGPMLGNSVSASISKAMVRAGVPGTPHALRHWFGTALRQVGVDSLVIKELMGHESLATTEICVMVSVESRSSAISALPTPSALSRSAQKSAGAGWTYATMKVRPT
jgi:integrase